MALIRCKKCGNLASSRSSACPICGEPIATAPATPAAPATPVAPTTPTVAPTANEPVAKPAAPVAEANVAPQTPTVEPAPQSKAPAPKVEVESAVTEVSNKQPKTLNDILAERNNAPKTVHDTLSGSVAEGESQHNEVKEAVTTTPIATPSSTPEPHQYSDDYYDDDVRSVEEYEADIRRHKRNSMGFMITSGILLLLMVGALFWGISERRDKKEYEDTMRKVLGETEAAAAGQLDLLRSNAEELVGQLEKYKEDNDSMALKYDEAVKMLAELEKENSYTLDQLKRYQNEVKTLKGIMKQYVRQIDSLNVVNKELDKANKQYKKDISNANLRADKAEEKAKESDAKLRQAEVIQVSSIKMYALNAKSKEVRRIKQAKRLRVDFELTANITAEPGKKNIYVRILNPDGYLLLSSDMVMFTYEGKEEMASAVREVDYENKNVPVSIFYDGEAFDDGTYQVEVYIDGRHCGSAEHYFY